MADYLYSVAIQVNSFHNNMADKTVWQINRGQINKYSLYLIQNNSTGHGNGLTHKV